MKNMFFTAFALMIVVLTACNDKITDDNNQGRVVAFVSGIDGYSTRVNANGDGWVAGDSVGIYMLKNGETTIVNGSENAKHLAVSTGQSTAFSTGNTLYYPTDGSAVDFIGYHPYSTKVAGMKYPVDLSNQSQQSALDLMYAESNSTKGEGYTGEYGSAVDLKFGHILTKLVMNVNATGFEGGINDMVVTIKGMDRTAEFNLGTGVLSTGSSNGDITPCAAVNNSYEAILLPLETLTENHTVDFEVNGTVYTWKMINNTATGGSSSITQFQKGFKYTFNISIAGSGVTATSVSVEGSVLPWEDGGVNTGTAEKTETNSPVTGFVDPTALYGYGVGTTGGQGATAANTFHFNDGSCFAQWLKLREKNKSTEPAIVWLSGEFVTSQGRNDMFDVKRTSNITFIGTDDFVMNKVGIFAKEASNIIFRNLYIIQPPYPADGISMQESNQIWVDHCTFVSTNQTKDAEDGSCDITHGSYNVTVSWCRFVTTQKSCLVGHSDSNGSTDKNIKVTFHHNHFENSSSRHPRLRFGTAHVYNNYYDNVTTYGAGSAYGAKLLLEDNYFDGVTLPTDICTYPAKKSGSSWVSNLTGSVAGYLYERNNTFANKPSNANAVYPFTNVEYVSYNNESTKLSTPLTYDDFKPLYTYIVDEVNDIPQIVGTNAGVGKLSNCAQAPLEVNNAGFTPGDTGGGDEEDTSIELDNDWFATGISAATFSFSLDDDGVISLTGIGKIESGKQAMAYVYRLIEGDFTMTTKLSNPTFNVTSNQTQAHVGLMITPDITKTESDFLYATTSYAADVKYYSSSRVAASVARSAKTLNAPTGTGGDVYLKLRRSGLLLYSSYSLDGGVTYGVETPVTFTELPASIHVGMLVSSGSTTIGATATFSEIKINEAYAPSFSE